MKKGVGLLAIAGLAAVVQLLIAADGHEQGVEAPLGVVVRLVFLVSVTLGLVLVAVAAFRRN